MSVYAWVCINIQSLVYVQLYGYIKLHLNEYFVVCYSVPYTISCLIEAETRPYVSANYAIIDSNTDNGLLHTRCYIII